MFTIPFDRFKIQTGLSPAEIQEKLSGVITRKRPILPPLGPAPEAYRGRTRENGFWLIRWIWYQNPYHPLFLGRVRRTESGSAISLKAVGLGFPIVLGSGVLMAVLAARTIGQNLEFVAEVSAFSVLIHLELVPLRYGAKKDREIPSRLAQSQGISRSNGRRASGCARLKPCQPRSTAEASHGLKSAVLS